MLPVLNISSTESLGAHSYSESIERPISESKFFGSALALRLLTYGWITYPGWPESSPFSAGCLPQPAGPSLSKLGPQFEKNQPKLWSNPPPYWFW